MTDELKSESFLIERLDRSLEGWEQARDRGFESRRDVSVVQAVSVFTVSAHTHRLGRAVSALHREALQLEAVPTIRSLYEHSLTAMWVAQYSDAAEGFINEHDRSRRNTVAETVKAGWEGAAASQDSMRFYGAGPADTDDAARSFQLLCEDLAPGGASAYAIFRVASMFTHPTPMLADHYFQPEPLAASHKPDQREVPMFWLFLACAGLVWAGRALDMLEDEHPRRAELRRTAEELGISCELKVSGQQALRIARKKAKADERGTSRGMN